MGHLLAEAVKGAANLAWHAFQALNTRIAESPSIHPEWAPGPLPKSYERTKPPLGWPRETESLCPRCVIDVRDAILAGKRDLSELIENNAGQIQARILEEKGRILIRKRCREHGPFEDVL
ncbi:MAG: radical SAM protein, partial [Acidobacteriota bacterium]